MAGKSPSDGSKLIGAIKPPKNGRGPNSGGLNGTGKPASPDAGKLDAGKPDVGPVAGPADVGPAGKPDAGPANPFAGPVASGDSIGKLAASLPTVIRSVGSADAGNDDGNDDSGNADAGNGGGYDGGYDPFERDASGNTIIGGNGKPKRKRGRKPDGGNTASGSAAPSLKSNKAALNTAVDRLAANIAILHLGIAAVSKMPELELTDGESRALAYATQNVMEQFATEIDPRVTAVVGLVTTAGSIYGPRAFVIRERKKAEIKKAFGIAADIPDAPKAAKPPTPENPASAVLWPNGKRPH